MTRRKGSKKLYYEREGMTRFECWARFKCEWCGKKIVSNGGEAGGFECSDPKCESNNDVFGDKTSPLENEIFTVLGLIFLLIVCYGLFK